MTHYPSGQPSGYPSSGSRCIDAAADPTRWPAATEEILRWNSPVRAMHRVAMRDTALREQEIREGDEGQCRQSVWRRRPQSHGAIGLRRSFRGLFRIRSKEAGKAHPERKHEPLSGRSG